MRTVFCLLCFVLSTLMMTVSAPAAGAGPGETLSGEGGAGDAVSCVKDVVVNTEVEIGGQRVHSMVLTLSGSADDFPELAPEDFVMNGKAANWNDPRLHDFTAAFSGTEFLDPEEDGSVKLCLHMTEFPVKYFFVQEFTVSCSRFPGLSFTNEQVSEVVTPVADAFSDGVFEGSEDAYHLFTPEEADGPVPVVVVFHGYGDTDNILTYRTSVEWAEPSEQAVRPCYVLSPVIEQYMSAPVRGRVYEEVHALLEEMIAAGQVDGKRVYVTGNSFGGAATVEFLERWPDFSAAAIVMCPALQYVDSAAFKNLAAIRDIPVWFAHAKSDQTIPSSTSTTAFEILEKAGAKNNRLTIYSDEEMLAAGGDPSPDATLSFHHVEIAVMPDAAVREWLFEQQRP